MIGPWRDGVRRAVCLFLLVAVALAGQARAQQAGVIAVIVSPAAGHDGLAVSWTAVEIDGNAALDAEPRAVSSASPVTGPWAVTLAQGGWWVSGFTATVIFEGEIAVQPGGDTAFVIPVLDLAARSPFRCAAPGPCAFDDAKTGLSFKLPGGWAAERPLRPGPEGTVAVFYEDAEGRAGAVWFLNPADWIVTPDAPCRPVMPGRMCTFVEDAPDTGADAAFALIAASLRQAAVP